MGNHVLKCLQCGKEYSRKLRMKCDNGCDSLLRSVYREKKLKLTREQNIFKFINWLPCENRIDTTIGPIVYRSEQLSKKLGLKNLYVAFNGYWPERGAGNLTATFKDYEALPTLINLLENGKKRIVLASAGNTARAFAYATTLLDFDTYIVIPDKMLDRLWLPAGKSVGRIHLLVIKNCCDYYRAIKFADIVSNEYDIAAEGGAKNIARRDGMGTVMLEAVNVMGKLPHHYFQAVGSGTGAIGAYEASLRLLQDERFSGQTLPRLNLAQNAPFAPIYKAWTEHTPIKSEENIEKQLEQINTMYANVLANRKPPFHIKGGVSDVLKHTDGRVYQVTNEESMAASQLFEKTEGIDIDPAASVCVAALEKAVKNKWLRSEEDILINITGGGMKKLRQDYQFCCLEPEAVIPDETDDYLSKIITN